MDKGHESITTQSPILNGLVLAGGHSKRMGHDKGLINWHGKPQRYHLADLMNKFCNQVFISCRPDQVKQIEGDGYKSLVDSADATGQFGAILSAFGVQPNNAWLVVACDLPFIDQLAIEQLLIARNPSKLATAFASDDQGLPEPLAAIWEPRAADMLRQRNSEGIDCPRKALILSHPDVQLIKAIIPDVISNVNTPEEAKEAELKIESYNER
ncbi:MAG: NTP transferase domain-containing protein [Candidatus Saccharimonadales bacterium]